MANTNLSGASFVMNDEFNLSSGKITMKGKAGEPLPDIRNEPVVLPIPLTSLIPGLLGALPAMANPGVTSLSLLERSAMAAIAVAGRIAVSPTTGGFNLDYLPALMRVTDGSYRNNGLLSAQDLTKLITAILAKMMDATGPARNLYSQLLSQAMEEAVQLPALKGIQPNCQTGGDPVNLNTGNFLYKREDLSIQGVMPLQFSRFYNRLDAREGSLGLGWRHNYEIELLEDNYSYTIVWQDGREEVYRKGESQDPIPLFGNPCRLERVEEGFCYKTQTGFRYMFNREGRLLNQRDAYGIRLRFSYDKQGRLERVSSVSGSLTYHYRSSDGRLIEVVDQTGRKIKLDYELGRLKQVTHAAGETYRYSYDEKKSIKRIMNPRGICVLDNSYDENGRTDRQIFADGGEITYRYQENLNRTLLVNQSGGKTAYVHDEKFQNVKNIYPDGEEGFCYNDRNQLISKTDKNGNKTKYSYDDKGNISQIIYPDGAKYNMTYDADSHLLVVSVNGTIKLRNQYDGKGNLVESTDALGRRRFVEYDENGRPLRQIQPDGSILSFHYDNRGNLTQFTDGAGNHTSYQYDDGNRVIGTTDGNGNRTKFSYDLNNRLTCVTNAAGKQRVYGYTKNGKIEKVIDFNGAVTEQKYNNMNQVKSVSLPDGGTIFFEYDLSQKVTRKTLPNGAEIVYTYDSLGRLEQITLPNEGMICYEYDPNGNRTAAVDPNGNRTTMEYDERNRLIKLTDPADASTEYEYDMEGHLISVINAAGKSHSYVYDEAGQLIRETDILGNVTCYDYNELGKLSCFTNPQGQKTIYHYGPGGKLERVDDSDGLFEVYSYDKNGNLTRRQNQKGDYLEFTYDCLNQLVKVRSSFGQEKSYTYNAIGEVTSITDSKGHTTQYVYSAGGKMTSVVDAAGNRAEYAYDAMGQLVTICRHGGKEFLLTDNGCKCTVSSRKENQVQLTRYERNMSGEIEIITNPLGMQEHYAYDKGGRLIVKTDREGYQTRYSYHATGDIKTITYADGRSVSFTYNPLRQLIQIQDWLGTTQIETDEAGRSRKVSDYKGREISYQWNDMGKQELLSYPDGRNVSYEYDACCRLVELRDGERTIQYKYDEEGHLSEKIFPDGILSRFKYNPMGQLSSLSHQIDGKMLEKYEYEYDLEGNKTAISKKRKMISFLSGIPENMERQMQEESGSYQYKYDSLNRLTEVWRERKRLSLYEYDAFGNRIRKQEGENNIRYHYNAANQLIREEGNIPEKSYQYDARGNLTVIFQGKEAVHRYVYDATNRLAAAINSREQAVWYLYDGLGNRVSVREYEALDKKRNFQANQLPGENPVREADYLLDLTRQYHNLLKKIETIGETQVSQRYTWDSNAVLMEEGGNAHVYLQDELGSTVRLVGIKNKSQMIYGYDEFGRDLYGTQGQIQPLGYTGYSIDRIANSYFAQAREYFPNIGKFNQPDILKGETARPHSLNEYDYCWGNPLKWIDLDGRKPKYPTPDQIWGEYFKEMAESAEREWNNAIQDIKDKLDKTVDVTAEAGYGIGGKTETGPVKAEFVVKAYYEVDEHLNGTQKAKSGLGAAVDDILDVSGGAVLNIDTGETHGYLQANKGLAENGWKLTFGGEVYAVVGGGGYITVDLDEVGDIVGSFFNGGKAFVQNVLDCAGLK